MAARQKILIFSGPDIEDIDFQWSERENIDRRLKILNFNGPETEILIFSGPDTENIDF